MSKHTHPRADAETLCAADSLIRQELGIKSEMVCAEGLGWEHEG